MSTTVSKNQLVCARCHFAGLASGMDCTHWSSSLSGAVNFSLRLRTAAKGGRKPPLLACSPLTDMRSIGQDLVLYFPCGPLRPARAINAPPQELCQPSLRFLCD